MTTDRHDVAFTLNGKPYERTVDGRLLLSDFIRHDLEFTGTHVGCEHGVCGSCTVLVDGNPTRSCLMLAVQADGRTIETVEALTPDSAPLAPLQAAFRKHHALQCGYCTPGFLMTATALLRSGEHLSQREIREAMSGNLCRCTGYSGIVAAVDEVMNGAGKTDAV